jgi:hypothetical protein
MPANQAGFLEAQEELSRWLEKRVEDVRSIAADLGVALGEEDVGLGLWVADHAARARRPESPEAAVRCPRKRQRSSRP